MGWIAAALSGILAAFSYPTVFNGYRFPELGFLAFFAWIPLFLSLRGRGARRSFAGAFVASLFHYSIGMYWIYTAMNSFGGLSPLLTVFSLSILFIVLSAYFGIIFAVSAWIARFTGWRMLWIRPLVWVGIEYLRGHLPAGGFPWSQVGYSQGGFLHFIQIADLFGVYGVTWLVVFINEALTEFIAAWRHDKKKRAWKALAPALLLFVFALGYGRYQLVRNHAEPIRNLKVGIVQGNISQDDKWRGAAARNIMDIFENGTMSLESEGAGLIIWPEAALPVEIPYDAAKLPYDLGQSRADVLFGAVTRSSKPGPNPDEEPYYNTVLLADGAGKILGHYHKRHLVPFGEYVPWQEYLSFARKMTAQVGQMLPGKDYHNIDYRGHPLGILICYEDIFPEISRIMAAKGAQ
ncbi:MAG TPA: apolipoprotein N-acyltransferase, partial [bacterium]|nr:apolipoprotein N-acyltransferase [bacterium]